MRERERERYFQTIFNRLKKFEIKEISACNKHGVQDLIKKEITAVLFELKLTAFLWLVK